MKDRPGSVLLRTNQALEHFSISRMTLHRWRQQDGFPQPLKNGHVVLYDPVAIRKWLEREAA